MYKLVNGHLIYLGLYYAPINGTADENKVIIRYLGPLYFWGRSSRYETCNNIRKEAASLSGSCLRHFW